MICLLNTKCVRLSRTFLREGRTKYNPPLRQNRQAPINHFTAWDPSAPSWLRNRDCIQNPEENPLYLESNFQIRRVLLDKFRETYYSMLVCRLCCERRNLKIRSKCDAQQRHFDAYYQPAREYRRGHHGQGSLCLCGFSEKGRTEQVAASAPDPHRLRRLPLPVLLHLRGKSLPHRPEPSCAGGPAEAGGDRLRYLVQPGGQGGFRHPIQQ